MTEAGLISAIVPTIGRPESLSRLLESLAAQSRRPDEVLVADGSDGTEVQKVVGDPEWPARGLAVRRIPVQPPNAVRQRKAAIRESRGEYLLLLDDDVALEPRCVEEMLRAMNSTPGVVAVSADFNNQPWSGPTRIWRLYLRCFCGLKDGEWQGRVVGPLLRFGYNPSPAGAVPMEWLGAGMSLVQRPAYDKAGGFSDFFLHRCTMNEDVDLGLKLGRVGRIVFCPAARMGHFHAPGGRATVAEAAEDDVYNRYQVLHKTCRLARWRAAGLTALYVSLESLSNLAGAVGRLRFADTPARICGRMRGLWHVLRSEA